MFSKHHPTLNRSWTLFWSIDPPPECSGSSIRSISCWRSSEIWILECHSRKCGLHSPLCCRNWIDNPAVISWKLETARNCTGRNQDYKKGCCITSVRLLVSQASLILAVCVVERFHGARSIYASTPVFSFEYATATVVIPRNNTPHRFSLSRELRADKWVLDWWKNHHVQLTRRFLIAHLFSQRTGWLPAQTFLFRFGVEVMHPVFYRQSSAIVHRQVKSLVLRLPIDKNRKFMVSHCRWKTWDILRNFL